jgi:hypothetical protein
MSVPGGKCRVLGIAGALACRLDGRSLPISLYELCRESSLQLLCQRGQVSSVPCPLMPLNEALPTALDLAGKVGSQRREAATELNFHPLPGWQGGLCGFRCGYCCKSQDLTCQTVSHQVAFFTREPSSESTILARSLSAWARWVVKPHSRLAVRHRRRA